MKVTVSLEEKDYWEFSKRVTSLGLNRHHSKWKTMLLHLVLWIVVGAFIAYLWREYGVSERSIVEVLGPTIAVLLVVGVVVRLLVSTNKNRLSPFPHGEPRRVYRRLQLLRGRTYCLSTRIFKHSKYFTGNVALQATSNFAIGPPLGATFVEVGLSAGIMSLALNRNDVKCGVQVSVASAVQTMPSGQS